MKSMLFRLNRKDILRGIGLAITTAGTYLFSVMISGHVPDMGLMKSVASVFGGSFGSYALKNFFTNSNDEFMKSEPCKNKQS